MRGLLIVNEFLNTTKFSEHTNWLLSAANKQQVTMKVMTNAECLVILNSKEKQSFLEYERPNFILFWDKDVLLARHLELLGFKVYNSAQAIADCDDKARTHLLLSHNGIMMPKTIVAPMTFKNIGYTNLDFLSRVEEEIGYPMVVKECFGSFGAQVYLVRNSVQLKQRVQALAGTKMLFQEFIASSAGKDLRLQVVGQEVVASMYRYSVNGDFRANITNGGHMKPYQPSSDEIKLALKCCEILNLTFAGVDLLFGPCEEPLVCEVNSNAHFKNIYDCTGVDTAKKMIEFIRADQEQFGT